MSDPVEFVTDHEPWNAVDGLEATCRAAIVKAIARMQTVREGTAVILFTCDGTVRALNAQYRSKDSPTNVLAFPAPESEGYPGDIALAYETCLEEAEAAGIALLDRAAHLALHGFLHLNGYTHEDEDDAAAMEALETEALSDIGIADPYLSPVRE